jgi:ankyrin repeat protein
VKRAALAILLFAVTEPALAAGKHTPALVRAVTRNCTPCAIKLLEAGAQIDARTHPGGDTAMHAAAALPAPDFVEFLASRGADPSAANTLGDTPLHIAARRGSPATVKALLARGAQVDAWSGDGTPLIAALRASRDAGYSNAVALLGAKADPNARDRRGDSALHVAVANGDARAVEALIRAGASLEMRNARGETPAELAGRLERRDALQAIRSATVRRPQ